MSETPLMLSSFLFSFFARTTTTQQHNSMLSLLRATLLVCLVLVAVVPSAVVGVVVESDWCDDVQAVHVPVSISKGSPITTGNGTAWTDANASVCTPVTSIDVDWHSYFTFNPDGPGTVKVLPPQPHRTHHRTTRTDRRS
jgi:hypothetical protein